MARLKTFTTEQGFFELAVAAPSRAGALRAWGMKHDLFAQGLARESQDKAAIAAAMARPGVVVKRPLGSKGAFGSESVLPDVRAVLRKAKKKDARDDRTEEKKAAQALKELDESHRRQMAALQEELGEVQTRIEEVSRRWKERRKQFTSSRPKPRR